MTGEELALELTNALPRLERAHALFHAALDAASCNVVTYCIGHSEDGEWVDDNSWSIVGALLAAGWTPPVPPPVREER